MKSTVVERTPVDSAAKSPAAYSMPASDGHLITLDGVRGAAILMVLIHHFISMRNTPGRLATIISGVSSSLWCGVDLFFVLSGFLVTRVLLNTENSPGFIKSFFIRRILRVFPLYYLTVIPAFAITLVGIGVPSLGLPNRSATYILLATYMTDFSAFFPREKLGSLFVFWSLAVEEHFYLLWPLAVLTMQRTGLLRTCGLIVAATAVGRIALLHAGVSPLAVYTMTISRADTLAIGAGLCLLVRPGVYGRRAYRLGYTAAAVAAIGLIVIAWWSGRFQLGEFDPLVQQFGYSLVAMGMGGLLTISLTGPNRDPVVRLCRMNILRWFGKYSYGIYIFHTMILVFTIKYLTPGPAASRLSFAIHGLLRPVFGIGSSVCIAWCSYHLIEQHMLRLKDVLAPVRRSTSHTSADQYVLGVGSASTTAGLQ